MSTAVAAPPVTQVWAPASPPETQYLFLHDVSWEGYVAIGDALMDRPRLRITYDQGDLEIMGTSPKHEYYKKHVGRFVEAAADEHGLAVAARGNMTFQRKDLSRGLESDDCFWIEHEREMRGKLTWVPLQDPPPDLVVEIEITRSAMNKMGIYAALRVPQVWRFDGSTLLIYVLRSHGSYERVECSPSFPSLPPSEIARFLQPTEEFDDLGVLRAFRAWVRQQLGKKETP